MTRSWRGIQVSCKGKASRHIDGVDVDARHLVYNPFVAISETPEASRLLRDIDERVETLARAVDRGWVADEKAALWCGLLR